METPNLDDRSLAAAINTWKGPKSVLLPEDEAYFSTLVDMIRAGKMAVVIVEDADQGLKYMFSHATRAEAMQAIAKVIEATAKRMAEGG